MSAVGVDVAAGGDIESQRAAAGDLNYQLGGLSFGATAPDYSKWLLIGGVILIAVMLVKKVAK